MNIANLDKTMNRDTSVLNVLLMSIVARTGNVKMKSAKNLFVKKKIVKMRQPVKIRGIHQIVPVETLVEYVRMEIVRTLRERPNVIAMKVTLAIDVMRALVRMMIVLTMNTAGMV